MKYPSPETVTGSFVLCLITWIMLFILRGNDPPRPEVQDMINAYIGGSPDIQFQDSTGEVIYFLTGGERKVITLESGEWILFRKASISKKKLEDEADLRKISRAMAVKAWKETTTELTPNVTPNVTPERE